MVFLKILAFSTNLTNYFRIGIRFRHLMMGDSKYLHEMEANKTVVIVASTPITKGLNISTCDLLSTNNRPLNTNVCIR